MTRLLHIIIAICGLTLSLNSCVFRSFTTEKPHKAVPLEGYATLGKLPFKEAWYGMYFQEDKVGYSHFKIEPSGEDYSISTDSVMRLTALKKTNEISMKEKVLVRPDLTMIGFESRVNMNGKDLKMVGSTEGDKFVVNIDVEGEKLRREYALDGKVYHSSAISLMPAIRGLKDGESYSFKVFNAEKQGMQKVDQQVWTVKGSPGPNGAVWKVKNTYGRSRIHSWLNNEGLTVLEKALAGSLITMLEDSETALAFLKKKTSGRDLVLDFSLIRVAKTIPNPEQVRFLKVKMQGIESSLIAQDHRQRVSGTATGDARTAFDVSVQVEDPSGLKKLEGTGAKESSSSLAAFLDSSTHDPVSAQDLASTMSIQSDHTEIVKQAKEIVSADDPDFTKITKLVDWTATNIENKMRDSFTALSVLRSKEGECQSHAGLYTALARSQKIPTRVVTGLVYTDKIGFLYHAWAESYVNGWIAVDPTLNQVPADATHIKIAPGDAADEAGSLLKMVGKVKMEVIDFK